MLINSKLFCSNVTFRLIFDRLILYNYTRFYFIYIYVEALDLTKLNQKGNPLASLTWRA